MQKVIQPPQVAPTPHGLVDTAFPSPEEITGDQHWETGFAFTPLSCAEARSRVIPCVGGASNVPAGDAGVRADTQVLDWFPFMVETSYKCTALMLLDKDFEAEATTTFLTSESKLIESEFYSGAAAGFLSTNPDKNLSLVTPSPDSVNAAVIGAGATTPGLALRSLVQHAATRPGGHQVMLHATPAVVEAWMQAGSLMTDRANRLVTKAGQHRVVSGTGYSGRGPSNSDPGDPNHHWVWVTSPVYLLRSSELVVTKQRVEGGRFNPEIVDRVNSDAEVVVRRTAAAFWDGCVHAGVLVDAMGTGS